MDIETESPSVLDKTKRPPTLSRFYQASRFQAEPHKFMLDLFLQYGNVVCWKGFFDVYLVNHPEAVRQVLSKNYEHYSKHTIDYRVLKNIMGNGLVSNDGPDWVRQRKLMQPVFSNRNVNSFDKAINDATAKTIRRWETLPADETVWMEREMLRLTYQIVGSTLFGTDIDEYHDDVAEILEIVNLRPQEYKALLTMISWLPIASNRRWRKAKKQLDKIVYTLIDQRRAERIQDKDILDRLLGAKDSDTGKGMSETQLRDEVVTLMLAGHETSANALAWTLHLLGIHPEIEQRLYQEIGKVVGDNPATAADLLDMPYLKQVVQESMRVYPPVWAVARRSEEPAEYAGFYIPEKSYIGIVPYALHRDPKHWPDPSRFDPDRFSPENSKGRHSYCYLPFAAGPRACIGASMAMLEIQLVLVQIVRRFKLAMVPNHPIDSVAKVTLRPRHGIAMTIASR
ncbi:MAG: cytochrome P450 [Gammaproteobacteria bacterium]